MGALAYLEWCYARNQFRAIARSPQRLLVWAPYLFFIGFFAFTRLLGYRGGRGVFVIMPSYATMMASGYVVALGVTIALAAGGRVAAFRAPSEAILFTNAGVRPLTAALWLQLRKLFASPMRWLGGFVYLFAIAAPKEAGPVAIVRALVAVALVMALVMGCELPAFLLGRGRLRAPLRVLGFGAAAAGCAFGIAALMGPHALAPLEAATGIDPGAAIGTLLSGDAFAMETAALCLAGLIGFVLVLGDDAMPELYAASLGAQAKLTRRRANEAPTYVDVRPARRERIPSGAFTLVWKDWVAFRRGRGVVRAWIAGTFVWIAAGVAAGIASSRFGGSAPDAALTCGGAVLAIVVAPMSAAIGLASDLSKPLFWLSAAPLTARMAAWTAARSWRGGFVLGIGPALAGVFSGNAALASYAIPISLVTYWSLQTLGVATYAVFPDPIDARGPLLLVRLILTSIYVAPATVAYGIVSIVTNQDWLAASVAMVILGAQGFGAIALASYRFREFGASLATIARAT